MPSEIIEPPAGTPPPEGSRPDPLASDPEIPAAPALHPSTSTSGDDLTLSLIESPPDPMLGEFVEGAATGPGPPSSDESFPAPIPESGLTGPSAVDSEAPSAGSFEAVPAPTLTVGEPEALPEAASAHDFPAIDLSAPPTARPEPPSNAEVAGEDDDEDEDDLPPRGTSWLTVLLASYASALTLFLFWHFREHRPVPQVVEPDAPQAADTRPDPGRRADQSTRFVPPPPLAADHLTSLGTPIRVGSLEVTPLAVRSGPVTLKRIVAGSEKRSGGNDALRLRLRLRNVSNDAAFFPLDEVYLREHEGGTSDSFIEASPGTPIEMYPLAVTSEWSIAGQEFRKLKPGESYETDVVSAADALTRKSPEMTWHVRFRTGIDQTAVVGIRFRDTDIQPAVGPTERPRRDAK